MRPVWLLSMAVVGIGILTVLVLSLAKGIPSPQDGYAPRTVKANIVYLEACAKCHGAQGEGTALAPPLKGRKLSASQVEEQVREGTGRMPRFPKITGEALANLTKFVGDL